MEVYKLLGLDHLDCHIAIIKNAPSRKMGKKDIIKIADDIVLDTEVLGYICPGATVNIIKDGKNVEKKKMSLPEKLVNVVTCHNPRCITTTEQELPQDYEKVMKTLQNIKGQLNNSFSDKDSKG